MKKSEKNVLLEWAISLSDKELEDAYYSSVYDSLGSETDEMYELGYDIRDIKEREAYEKYLCEKSDILGSLCEKRNIMLWERGYT
ncbi:MAG: hypothetical protein K2G55_11785 [Lachnospiraceae bacterium]|nr:hypothetical protein [Lachnospiraceae bacterium]